VKEGAGFNLVRDLRSQFSPIANSFRRHRSRSLCFLGVLAVAALGLILLEYRALGGLTFILGYIAFAIYAARSPQLMCPGCSRNVDIARLEGYCPQCGAPESIPRRNVLTPPWNKNYPKCSKCETKFNAGRAGKRIYRVHFCTHCGAFIDEHGV